MIHPINNTDHSSEQKLTATEVTKKCPAKLQKLGEHIAAHLEKAYKYEEKAEQHYTSISQYLADAKQFCDEGGFAAFCERFFPNLGRSRVHELLSIAAGKTSIEEVRANTRQRVAKHRAKRRDLSVTVTDKSEPGTDPDECEVEGTSIAPEPAKPERAVSPPDEALYDFTARIMDLVSRTKGQKVERFAETAVPANNLTKLGKFLTDLAILKKSGVVKSITGFVSQGNDVDTTESAETMKAAQEANSTEDAASEDDPATDESNGTGDAAAA